MTTVVRPLLLVASFAVAFSQSPGRLTGLNEPPELTGDPKSVQQPMQWQIQFNSIKQKWDDNDPEKVRSLLTELDNFIHKFPHYSAAYALRAFGNLCILKSKDYYSIEADINKGIETHSSDVADDMFTSADLYSMRGKLSYQMGRYEDAMKDLETAMMDAMDDASRIFKSQGTDPEASNVYWSKKDLDELLHRFPKDYRSYLLRGLYKQQFLPMFKKTDRTSYDQVFADFKTAALLYPRSPLPPYYFGHLTYYYSNLTSASFMPDAARKEVLHQSIQYYTSAIILDSDFLSAYKKRANAYSDLSLSRQEIQDYDKILELDPENASAYNKRAMAEGNLERWRPAISDYDEAIKRKSLNDASTWIIFQNQASCYLAVQDYPGAVATLSRGIEAYFKSQPLFLNLRQWRALYPEYDGISDEVLLRKLHALLAPEYQYGVFVEALTKATRVSTSSHVLSELYGRRANAYLRIPDFRRAASDFNRIYRGMPDLAGSLDRWLWIGVTSDGGGAFLDVRTLDVPSNGAARLWLKTSNKTSGYTVGSYEIDCKGRRIDLTSSVVYDAKGEVLKSLDGISGWTQIVPGTLGEHLYDGICR